MSTSGQSPPAITWPTIGSRYVDSEGRTLVVRAVDPKSKQERHVQGEVLGRPYACDLRTFDVVWLPGALDEAGVLLRVPEQVEQEATPPKGDAYAPPKPTPLYRDGKALPYTRRQ